MIAIEIWALRPEYKGEWRRRNCLGVFHESSHVAMTNAVSNGYVAIAGWERCEPQTEFEIKRRSCQSSQL